MQQESPQLGLRENFVDVDGARIFYLHAGTGPPMLLIHGLVGSSEDWRQNMVAFAQHASVYAIDLLNMGKSERLPGVDPGLRATAHRIVAVMDALQLNRADIVAHSYGGALALMVAALHRKRVRRLILFAPANPFCRSSDPMVRLYSTSWGAFLAWILPYVPAALQRIALADLYGGSDRVVDRCREEIVCCLRNPGTLRHVLGILRCWFAEMSRLGSALCRLRRLPVLLVWGDRDRAVTLRSGIRLHRKLPGSELIVVPGGGHSVFEDMPAQCNGIVLDWLIHHPVSGIRSGRATPKTEHRPGVAFPSKAASRRAA